MCVIAYKPPGEELDKEDMRLCFERNPDGAGFMYPDRNTEKLTAVKGLMTFDAFWKAYEEHVLTPGAGGDGQGVAVHFRIGTSGKKDELNCHPHVLGEDLAFVHNGILSDYVRTGEKAGRSDTHWFMEEAVRPFYEKFGKDFLSMGSFRAMIKDHIGPGNKMVFISGYPNPLVWILNEKQGSYIGKIWYSNTYWKLVTHTQLPLGAWRGRDEWEDDPHGSWGGGSHKTYAYDNGCYVKRKWMTWPEYRDKYPKKDGPFEKEFREWAAKVEEKRVSLFQNRKGQIYDEQLKKWIPDPNLEAPKSEETQKDFGAEIDDQGNVIKPSEDKPEDKTATETEIVPLADLGQDVDAAPDICTRCKEPLITCEVENAEGICIDCMIDETRTAK